MGALFTALPNLPNDYERVIKSSKDLEWLLEGIGGTGRGLHEKVTSVQDRLPPSLVRQVRYIATIRNKLIHERGFDAIPDRGAFNSCYEACRTQLVSILSARAPSSPVPPLLAMCSVM